jgi:hypothetical protein
VLEVRAKVVVGVVGGLCLLLAAFLFAAFRLSSDLGLRVPDAASEAAQRDYVRQTGAHNITVERVVGWRTCAIVELAGVPTTGVVAVVVTGEGDAWKVVRIATEEPGQSFDTDSVSSSEDCVALARGK